MTFILRPELDLDSGPNGVYFWWKQILEKKKNNLQMLLLFWKSKLVCKI